MRKGLVYKLMSFANLIFQRQTMLISLKAQEKTITYKSMNYTFCALVEQVPLTKLSK